jgi:hypothetical protein
MTAKKTSNSSGFEYRKMILGALITFAFGLLGKIAYDYMTPAVKTPQYQFMVNVYKNNEPAKTSMLNIYEQASGSLEYEGASVDITNFQYMPQTKLFFDAMIDQQHLKFGSLYIQAYKNYSGFVSDDNGKAIGRWEAVEKPK